MIYYFISYVEVHIPMGFGMFSHGEPVTVHRDAVTENKHPFEYIASLVSCVGALEISLLSWQFISESEYHTYQKLFEKKIELDKETQEKRSRIEKDETGYDQKNKQDEH